MATNAINFFQPGTDGAADMQQIQRQREMAALLMKQGQTPAQGQMVSGHYVAPSWISGLANVLKTGVGSYMGTKADQQEKAIVNAQRDRNASDLDAFIKTQTGTPAVPGRTIQPLTPNDDEGNPMPAATVDAIPAKAPDRQQALAIALRSQNPLLQQAGSTMLSNQIEQQQLADTLRGIGLGGAVPGGPGGAGPGAGGPAGADGAPAAPGGLLGGGNANPTAIAADIAFNKGKGIGGLVAEANKPVNVAEGGTLFNPATREPMFIAPKTEPGIAIRNGSAMPIPGYADSKGQLERSIANARQGAESDNTIVTVDLPGGPRQMTRAQALELARGGAAAPAQGMPPRQPVPPVAGNFAGPGYAGGSAAAAATGQAEILTAELGKAQQAVALAQQKGDAEGAARALSDVAGIQRELGRLPGARSAPVPGAMPAGAAGGPGIAVQGEAAKQYDTARAKDFAGRAAEVQKGGMSASNMMRNFDTLETLYKDPNVASGAAAESISNLKSLASSFGVETKGLGAEQAVAAITNKMALDLRSTADGGGMPGAMSDADRNFLSGLTPNLTKSPEGRALIIDAGRKAAQRQIEVARMATDYERQNGRLDIGFDRMLQDYTTANPLYSGMRVPKAEANAPAAPMDFRAAAAAELARRQKGR